MNKSMLDISKGFQDLVNEIPHIGFKQHASVLLKHAKNNSPFIKKSIKDVPALAGEKAESAIILSAGPSLRRKNSLEKIKQANYKGTIIAVDGTYIAALRAGIVPDYIVTLDPHTTRMVRWFGDPNFEKNATRDDYFMRQDLDVEFRKNTLKQNVENIELFNKHASQTKGIVATSAPENVVGRMDEANCQMYWWNPLVDDPTEEDSLTKQLHGLNKLPCMNTGGTVGTAAWIFAATRLKIKNIALVGVDYGYYNDTPHNKTQTYYELINKLGSDENIEDFFIENTFPLTDEKFFIDPTYYWYRKNFLDLMYKVEGINTFNCSEGGTLVDDHVKCVWLDDFLNNKV